MALRSPRSRACIDGVRRARLRRLGEHVYGERDCLGVTCTPNPDPEPMRVPSAAIRGQETLEYEADETFIGTGRDQKT